MRDYANADGAGAPRAAWAEWYTLSENLYRAFLATGDAKYFNFAEVWEYTEYWDLYARKADIFAPRPNGEQTSAYHAYSHVNTLSGAAAAYIVKGDPRYLDTLKNAYDYLQSEQTFATGGYGPNEALVPRGELVRSLGTTHNHFETQCGSWAAFKMAKYLICLTGDARYGDWIERLIFNGIGASILMSADGRVFYYSDYHLDGAEKRLYDSGWACCAGTRPIAIADYHDLIYFKDAGNLYINLFAPSAVTWNQAGSTIKIQQRTAFPESPAVEVTVSAPRPTRFGIALRVPEWLAEPMSVSVNGRPVAVEEDAHHWARLHCEWREGDRVSVTLPIRFSPSSLDRGQRNPAAIMYGPVAMAIRSPGGNPSGNIGLDNLDRVLVPSEGEPLTYHLRSDPSVLVRPFYAFKEGERYFIYLSSR